MTRFRVGPMVWVFGALFVVVTVLVADHATRHLDQSVYDWLTPTGSWNQTHQLVSDVPDWTAPHFQLVAFGIFVLVLARRRRSTTSRPSISRRRSAASSAWLVSGSSM